MLENTHFNARGSSKRRGVLLCTVALTAAFGLWGARPAEGNPPQDVAELKAKAAIEELGVRYASASDAIGRGDVEEGRQLYGSCFTADALIELVLPDQAPGAPPYFSVIGPDAYTDIISAGFSSYGYTATQHQIGNTHVTVQGNTATMMSYVTAYHVLDWSNSVNLGTAMYTDHVVHTPAGWRIAHRLIRATTFLQLSGSPPPLP